MYIYIYILSCIHMYIYTYVTFQNIIFLIYHHTIRFLMKALCAIFCGPIRTNDGRT